MLLEKEILIWKNDKGLTSELEDVKLFDQSDFPKLIFQDFSNQLKLPKLRIGFELNTNKLIGVEPVDLEQLDDTSTSKLTKKYTHNLMDILTYYLLTEILHADFKLNHIYTNNHAKAGLFFENQMPFSVKDNDSVPELITFIVKNSKATEVNRLVERFFILMGEQYQDKLILFLTYLDTKYNFKLDKVAFVESTLGPANFNRVKRKLALKLNIHA